MSIFLLTLKGGNMQNGSISIGKELQRHGQFSHGAPNSVRSASGEAPSTVQDQVNFRIYPSDNTQVYDLAAIGLRKDATQDEDNYDIPKFYSEDNSAFQIYSLSASGAKLAANGVPLNTDTVQLYFKAPSRGGNFIIEATNTSTLSSEGAWTYAKGDVVTTSTTAVVKKLDLAVNSVTPSVTSTTVGNTITYTVVVKNIYNATSGATSDAVGATFGLEFPSGFTITGHSTTTNSGTFSETSFSTAGTLFSSVFSLTSGGQATYIITGTVGSALAHDKVLRTHWR